MSLDFSAVVPYVPLLLKGTVATVKASALSSLLGFVLGLFLGVGLVVPVRGLRLLCWCYVYFVRGTPLLVQLFIIYFGLPSFGVDLGAFASGVLGLGLNSAAYVAEIVRAGIEAIPKGQMEACRVLGLSYSQAMRFVVLPQALRNMLPAFANEFATVLKQSSLLSSLAITELTMAGQQVRSVTFASFETFAVVALIYLALTSAIGIALRTLERRWSVS